MMIQPQYFEPLLQAKIYLHFVCSKTACLRHRGKLTKKLNAWLQTGVIL